MINFYDVSLYDDSFLRRFTFTMIHFYDDSLLLFIFTMINFYDDSLYDDSILRWFTFTTIHFYDSFYVD
jgi:hypothetical protein